MDVSVIIPSYNRADPLPLTLEAVLAQTLLPWEIIVVDDGSRDDTVSMLGRYKRHVRVVSIRNSGSIAARNFGLRQAATPVVAFCDSDDLWRPDFLEQMAALWRAEPRMLVAYANFQIVRDDRWESETKFENAPPGFWSDLQWLGNGLGMFDQPVIGRLVGFQPFFPSACVVDRRAMIDAGGWDEGVGRTVGDDLATVLRLAELHPFGVVWAPLVGIRKHSGNFSANVRAMNLGDASVLEFVLASRPSLLPHADLIRDSIAKRRCDAMDSAFADGDFEATRSIYALLPAAARSNRSKLKRMVSSLPRPLAVRIQRLLSSR